MFTLNLLGGAAFHGLNGPVSGRAAHRRRVALLAILAVARGRTVGRERIVGLLWPDQTAARARHLLSESLYVLRKELGADAFVSAGDEVGLNGAVVRSDVEEFEAEIEAGRPDGAARVYRGPFLDGFFVADAPEFERWAEGERARLAAAHARAVECLAAAREREGRPAEAAEWWRRLVGLDPYDSRVGMRLMLALDAAGQRAAALWFAETHTAFLRDELGVEPEDDFAELVERLRTEPVRVPAPPTFSPPAGYVDDGDAGTSESLADPWIVEDAGNEAHPPVALPPTPPVRTIEAIDPVGAEAESGVWSDSMESAESSGAVERAESIESSAAIDPADLTDAVEAVEWVESADGAESTDDAVAIAPANEADGERGRGARGGEGVDGDGGIGLSETGSVDMAEGRSGAGAVAAKARVGDGAERRLTRPGRLAALAAAVAAVAIGIVLLASRGTRATEAPRPAGYDPRHIAVLYFDDHSQGGELGYLANGLTEMLIHQLSQVEALEVVSRNAVKAYRETPVPFDSLVDDLRVGSVVEGSVQRSGDEVRVTVQLVDAATRSHLESRTIVHPMGDVFALEDALADSVSGFLRRRLGREVKLRRIRGETRSAEAWRWVMEAEEVRDAAARFLRAGASQDAASAVRALARADSLLAAAERADPAWVRPTVLRGWVAYRAAPLSPSPAAREDAALAFAERALARAPGDAGALELRGLLLFARALASSNGAGARIDRAEADLRAAVAAEPGLASAWGTLSQVLRYRGRLSEADAAARRALAEDAYLEGAEDLLHRLFFRALLAAEYAQADSVCRHAGNRFRGGWKSMECRLLLLRADPSRPPDAARAAELLAELDHVDPPERARREGRAYSPLFRQAVVAAVTARAGDADSARAMLARARKEAGSDDGLRASLAYDAAYVHLVLGEPDSARALLAWAFTRRPAMRDFASRDPLFRGLPLPSPGSAPKAGVP